MTHQINPAPHGERRRRRRGDEPGRMAGDSEQRLEEQGQPSGGEPFLIGVSGGTASGKVRARRCGEPRRGRRSSVGRPPRPGAAATWQRGGSERPPRHVRGSAAGPGLGASAGAADGAGGGDGAARARCVPGDG